MMISGDLGYMGKERLQELREEIGDIEKILKALIKSRENKHLNPGPLGPFLTTYWILACGVVARRAKPQPLGPVTLSAATGDDRG